MHFSFAELAGKFAQKVLLQNFFEGIRMNRTFAFILCKIMEENFNNTAFFYFQCCQGFVTSMLHCFPRHSETDYQQMRQRKVCTHFPSPFLSIVCNWQIHFGVYTALRNKASFDCKALFCKYKGHRGM